MEHDTTTHKTVTPEVNRVKIESIEEKIDVQHSEIERVTKEVHSIKRALWVIAGLAGGDLVGVKEMIAKVLQL